MRQNWTSTSRLSPVARRLPQQRGGLVDRLHEGGRHVAAGGDDGAGLRVPRHNGILFEGIDQGFAFMAFLPQIADAVGGGCVGRDVALGCAFDGDVYAMLDIFSLLDANVRVQ